MGHVLHPCKASAVCKLHNTDCAPRVHFVNLHLYGVHDRETDPTVILYVGHPLFQLGECMNSQHKRFPFLICKAPLHFVKVGLWCAAIVIICLIFRHVQIIVKSNC